MRILFISTFSCLESFANKGDTHALDLWNYLVDKNESMKITCEEGFNVSEIEKFKPEIIWCYHINQVHPVFYNILSYCKTLKVPVAILIDDFFHVNFFKNSHHNLVDAVVFKVKHDNYKLEYKKEFPDKFVGSIDVHYINFEKFHNWDIEKQYDIFIYGSRSCMLNKDTHSAVYNKYKNKDVYEFNFYEFRERIIKLLETTNYKLNIVPYAPANDCPVRGEYLSREISKAYIGLATKCVVDKCMMKYIEISASDTVVLGDVPTDYRDLFNGNIIEIREDMSDSEIIEVIDKELSDKKCLEKRSKEFGKKLRDMYTNDNYAKYFNGISREIIDYCSNHS